MNTDHAPNGDPAGPSRHSLGRAIAAVPDQGPSRQDTGRFGPDRAAAERSDDGALGDWFAVVLRGYDRAQVDARLAELDRRVRDEIVRADTAEAALTTARSHVRRLQESAAPGTDDRGFGLRVERVLQAAEREAAELREKASTEAAAVVEKAREDAERARTQTEEALLGRAAKLDDEFTARSAALDAREQEVDRIVERARTEAEQIRADAEHAAAETSSAAERRAANLLVQAERTIEEQRADATRDIGRMAALRDEVRQELSRLHGLLRGELDDGGPVDLFASPTAGLDAGVVDGGGVDGVDAGGDHSSEADVSTTIGTIPSYSVASVGVLPFGDRAAGGPASGRSFAFDLVPGMRTEQGADQDDVPDAGGSRTRGDAARLDAVTDRNPTRSPTPSRGRR